MSEFKASGFRDEFGSGGPDLVGITTMTSPYYFVPPSGSTAERPGSPPPGMLRFNTDIGRLEIWRNDHWATILGESPNLGDQNNTNSSGGTGTRGVIMGEAAPNNEMEFLTISTLGDTQDFGDLTRSNSVSNAGFGSRTRGFAAAGGSNEVATTDTFVFASTGNATSFGDVTQARRNGSAVASSTRGVFGGGWGPAGGGDPNGYVTTIDYCTMATTGTWQDFGDLLYEIEFIGQSAAASSVRGVWAGGSTSSPSPATRVNTLQYVTISTTGNSLDFGDLSNTARSQLGAVGSSTRAVFGGGDNSSETNEIDFITIASTGNSQDFGDLITARRSFGSPTSLTRGLFMGGYAPSASRNIEYITIATTGNGIEFGEITDQTRRRSGSCSNGHGGL